MHTHIIIYIYTCRCIQCFNVIVDPSGPIGKSQTLIAPGPPAPPAAPVPATAPPLPTAPPALPAPSAPSAPSAPPASSSPGPCDKTWQDMTSCPASCISCQLRSTEIRKNLKLISRDCIHCTSAGYLLRAIHFGKLKMLKDIFMYCDSLCVTFPQSWMRSFAGLDAIPAKSFTLSAELESDWADKGLWSTFLTSCVFKGALQS